MRYSIFVNRFMRPEVFRSCELVEAMDFARQFSGDVHVFDWLTWRKIELERPARLAVGT
jgi:hypothetical protein